MSRWKSLGFGLTVTLVFFLILELLLAAMGVQPVLYQEDPYVGFSSTVPLFAEQTASDGTLLMVTAQNKLRLLCRRRAPAAVWWTGR